MTCPARPSLMICGLIRHKVQLLMTPVDGIVFGLKKKSSSLFALSKESEPCTAFLVPSVPKTPLIEFGASFRATSELVGPINYLQAWIPFILISSIPMQTSLVMNCDKVG